jgi:acyl carrier protein
VNDAALKRIRELLSFYSGVPEDQLTLDSRPENTPGWDSVANLGLLAAVEEEFNVTIKTRDAVRLRSLGDIAAYVGDAADGKASGEGA